MFSDFITFLTIFMSFSFGKTTLQYKGGKTNKQTNKQTNKIKIKKQTNKLNKKKQKQQTKKIVKSQI